MSALPGNKICPLLLLSPHLSLAGEFICFKSYCAWWNGAGEECCVRTFASFANLKIMDYTTRR